ncbi:YqaE/Pmp3 family membrane protein [Cryomorphaceae bacterium 1068]|nr:YqaE/Pmp3 family membrane protein [Cryomorphaceae bacterium 1068]
MKRLSALCLLVVILATSCQTSSELGSTSIVQKRRYTKGFNLNIKKPSVASKAENENASQETALAEAKTPDMANKSEAQVIKVKTEERIEMESASIELSKALMAKPVTTKQSELEIADTPSADKAYPLRINTRKNRVSGKTAKGDVNFHEVNVWTIIITVLLPPLGVALILGVGTEFWISLVLTLLFYFPGLIYSLIILLT